MEASALHAPQGLGRLTARGPLLRLRSDDQLVALFRMGYDEAFQVMFDRYRARLFAYTRQMLAGSRSDAEDALQDVFLRAYSALRCDDRPVTLRAWLYRVAHNRCIDQLRRPTPAPADVLALSRTPLHDPLDEAERREDLRRLVADVRRLPEQQRSALLMRELEGLTYQELGDALGVSIPAVKSLLVRARVGLVEAGEARDAACAEIRDDLLNARHRGVRCDGRSRRHLRDCRPCRDFQQALRGERRWPAALVPGPGPLGALAKLLGIGGAGSGAAAGATAGGGALAGGGGALAGGGAAMAGGGGLVAGGGGLVAGGGGLVAGGAVAGTATKVAAVLCCAAMVGGGAAEVRHKLAPVARTAPAPSAQHGTATGGTSAVPRTVVLRVLHEPAAPGIPALAAPPAGRGGHVGAAGETSLPATRPADAPLDAAPADGSAPAADEPLAPLDAAGTGGMAAPADDPADPASAVPPTGSADAGDGVAAAPGTPGATASGTGAPATGAPADATPGTGAGSGTRTSGTAGSGSGSGPGSAQVAVAAGAGSGAPG